MEDIAVVYLGSAVFKIFRLTFIALFFVHLFACLFFWVKLENATSPEEVIEFYTSRNANDKVGQEEIYGISFSNFFCPAIIQCLN